MAESHVIIHDILPMTEHPPFFTDYSMGEPCLCGGNRLLCDVTMPTAQEGPDWQTHHLYSKKEFPEGGIGVRERGKTVSSQKIFPSSSSS